MKIGVTLLYSEVKRGNVLGILKSYIVDCENKNEIFDVAYNRAIDQIELYFPNYIYHGIEDVFTIIGKVDKINLISRSTLYDVDEIFKAEKLAINKIEEQDKEVSSDLFCSNLVYFYKNRKKENDNYTFIITVLIRESNINSAINALNAIADSFIVLEKIESSSVEQMDIDNIRYVGVENIFSVKENINKGGSFQTFFNDDFKSEEEILSVLPSKTNLQEIVKDVFEQ